MMDEETTYQHWLEYLNGFVNEIQSDFDNGLTSYHIRYKDLPILIHDNLAENPVLTLRMGDSAVQSLLQPDQKGYLNLRLIELPKALHVHINDIRAINLGHLVEVRGVVRKATDPESKLTIGVFKCTSCGWQFEILQSEHYYTEPLECNKEDGGCGKRKGSTTFAEVQSKGLNIDYQKIQVESRSNSYEQPQRLDVNLLDDLVGKAKTGDEVIISGIIYGKYKYENGKMTTTKTWYLEANHLENTNKRSIEDLEADEDEIEKFRKIARGKPLDWVSDHICPSIYGYNDIKRSLALSLVGGIRRGEWRSDIHILLAGDPGTAKSKLISEASKLAPIGYYTSGKGASAAGLTAAVVKDEFAGGQYNVEGGLMVLGDMGIVAIDEMDKMDKTVVSSLNEAMEQQTVSVSKAGVQASLNARTTVWSACNPKHGKFRMIGNIAEQIEVDLTFLSRITLGWYVTDVSDVEKDKAIARHIYEHMYTQKGDVSEHDRDLVRKYIHYAKKLSIHADEEVWDYMAGIYSNFRVPFGKDGENKSNITTRVAEDLARLASAHARIHLRTEMTKEDVDYALSLLEKSLRQVTAGEDGEIDMLTFETGKSKSTRTILHDLKELLVKMIGESPNVKRQDYLDEAVSQLNKTQDEIEDYVEKLKKEGIIYFPPNDGIDIVRR